MTVVDEMEAKETFSLLIDKVQSSREPVYVSREGRQAVKLVPVEPNEDPLAAYYFGGFDIAGDIESPANDPRDWEYD